MNCFVFVTVYALPAALGLAEGYQAFFVLLAAAGTPKVLVLPLVSPLYIYACLYHKYRMFISHCIILAAKLRADPWVLFLFVRVFVLFSSRN